MVTTRDLAALTGLDRLSVETVLDRLVELGAVTWEEVVQEKSARPAKEPKPTSEPPKKADPVPNSERPKKSDRRTSSSREARKSKTIPRVASRPPAVESYHPPPSSDEALALYDPSELDEDCELPQDKRRRVLDTFYRLEDLDYYMLLGVHRDATKKVIKDAYYRLASEYHPDRYFRKNLGSFKQKMEVVFTRITLASDTLTRKQLREEYDAYLSARQATEQLEQSLRSEHTGRYASKKPGDVGLGPHRAAGEPDGGRGAASEQGLGESGPAGDRTAGDRAVSSEPGPANDRGPANERGPESARGSSGPPGDRDGRHAWHAPRAPTVTEIVDGVPNLAEEPPGRVSTIPSGRVSSAPSMRDSVRARREAFAARMSGGRVSRMPPPRSSNPPSRVSIPPEQAGEALRRHMQERRESVRRTQLRKYTDAAKEAMDRDDPAGAANAYQLALQIAPDDPALAQAQLDAQEAATKKLAGGYLQQARYEERADRFREAARSYSRAADGMLHDAEVQAKAAEMMLRSDQDMRKAAEYVKRALVIDPRNVRYHVILGKIYLAAGLVLNARRELELAAEIAPNDVTIARLLEGIRKSVRS